MVGASVSSPSFKISPSLPHSLPSTHHPPSLSPLPASAARFSFSPAPTSWVTTSLLKMTRDLCPPPSSPSLAESTAAGEDVGKGRLGLWAPALERLAQLEIEAAVRRFLFEMTSFLWLPWGKLFCPENHAILKETKQNKVLIANVNIVDSIKKLQFSFTALPFFFFFFLVEYFKSPTQHKISQVNNSVYISNKKGHTASSYYHI